MTLWWIGNAVVLLVVVPLVVALLVLLLRAALEVDRRANEVAEGGRGLAPGVEGLRDDLAKSAEVAKGAGGELERYGKALAALR